MKFYNAKKIIKVIFNEKLIKNCLEWEIFQDTETNSKFLDVLIK